jgi:hypothetical protein
MAQFCQRFYEYAASILAVQLQSNLVAYSCLLLSSLNTEA